MNSLLSALLSIVRDFVPYLADEVTGLVSELSAVAVLINGFGMGVDAMATGPTTQLTDAPIASDTGRAHTVTSGSVTFTVLSTVSPSFETVNL